MDEKKLSSSSSIERTSSIENEPLTLKIDSAREAAISVVNTRSMEEAMKIFTEGLEPVVRGARDSEGMTTTTWDEYLFCCPTKFSNNLECKDIASAPF